MFAITHQTAERVLGDVKILQMGVSYEQRVSSW